MNEQQIQEIFEELEKAGMQPMLCDTPVPYFENGVRAGIPTDPGDIVRGDYVVLPRELLGWQPVFIVRVKGDSMRDAGILPGDRLHVQLEATVDDGDIVVASIDGECTVKAFCTDDRGRKWLVPRNDKYKAIRLTADKDVRIMGKVVEHIKDAPRTSFNDCMRAILQSCGDEYAKEEVSRQKVEKAVAEAARLVKNGRHWYAVYRAMADRGAVGEGDYTGFAELVSGIVPEHDFLPKPGELRRMAVQSFSKPVALWNQDDAPVSGQRFDDYLLIAKATNKLLK